MRVLIYLRVSSEGQARKENPIATQRAACLEYAQRNGYGLNETTDIYIDNGVSGRTANRVAFQEMLERLKKDGETGGVIAYDMSRIFRNGVEYILFLRDLNKWGKRFFSIMEPFHDDGTPAGFISEWLMAGIGQFNSMHYGAKIREAMKCKAESGVYPGRAPYGYINVRDKKDYGGKEKRWIETDQSPRYGSKRCF